VEAATKLIIIAIAMLGTAGFLAIARQVHGRIPPTAFFALPLIWSLPFLWGFVNFALSIALACCAYVLWLRLADAARLGLRAAVFVPLSLLLWTAHIYGWAVLCVLAGTAELDRQIRARDKLKAEVRKSVQQAVGLTVDDVIPVDVGALPKTSSGKLQRAKTRQQYLDGTVGKDGVRTIGSNGEKAVIAKHVAKSLLGHERLFVGSPKLCQHALHQLRELLVANGQIDNAATRDALTGITLDVLDLEALYGEYAAIVKQGGVPGADISVLKIWSTETYVRLSEMILEAAGDAAGIVGKQAFGDARIDVLSHFYNARPAPIYAGSNEIQRNILAKQVLRLPT
jgi:hypothetical protein